MECHEIREENANILVRSEKIPQKGKKMIIWIISALLVITTLTFLVIDYSGYKNVGIENDTLKITVPGFEFRISNLTNAESMKDVIIEKKKSVQDKLDSSNISNADELKKYKDLWDNGIISKEEFDAKNGSF